VSVEGKQIASNLAFSAAAGAAIWALAPVLTGHTEPWDSDGLYYPLALFAAGIVLGSIGPRAIWAHAVGIVLGQLLYMVIFLPLGPLLLVGVVFLIGYSVLTLGGAGLGVAFRPTGKWKCRGKQDAENDRKT
jgi:hypothetical protein